MAAATFMWVFKFIIFAQWFYLCGLKAKVDIDIYWFYCPEDDNHSMYFKS